MLFVMICFVMQVSSKHTIIVTHRHTGHPTNQEWKVRVKLIITLGLYNHFLMEFILFSSSTQVSSAGWHASQAFCRGVFCNIRLQFRLGLREVAVEAGGSPHLWHRCLTVRVTPTDAEELMRWDLRRRGEVLDDEAGNKALMVVLCTVSYWCA